MTSPTSNQPFFTNKKAYHDYFILETLEVGIVLQGSEVKAIRTGRLNLKESFIRIIKGEVFIFNLRIRHLQTAHTNYRPNEEREKKLLLHKNQIDKLFEKVTQKGLTLVPLKLYFNQRNRVKLQIALAQGKKLYDKREDLKQKTLRRETQLALKQ